LYVLLIQIGQVNIFMSNCFVRLQCTPTASFKTNPSSLPPAATIEIRRCLCLIRQSSPETLAKIHTRKISKSANAELSACLDIFENAADNMNTL
jgi:hypothetical protein